MPNRPEGRSSIHRPGTHLVSVQSVALFRENADDLAPDVGSSLLVHSPLVFGGHSTSTARLKRTQSLRAADVLVYRVCEDATEALIYFMVVFSPWAFGTTQPWSIWTMNVAGFSLGAVLLAKLVIRRLKGLRPARWGEGRKMEDGRFIFHLATPNILTNVLAILTALILGYCLISAINARSTYHPEQLSFEYHRYWKWLPHSFDRGRTWFSFWSYLALACWFWAVRDWLLGKSVDEERAERQQADAGPFDSPLLPSRLRRLLWVLSVNGGLLGLEAIVQRLEGSGRLLFLVRPQVNPAAVTQYGPYAYRGNAASYFNLLWPLCLGFWWTLHRQAERLSRLGRRNRAHRHHHLLLACCAILAAGPIISTSRGGALISVGMAMSALVLFGYFLFRERARVRGKRRRSIQSPVGANIELSTTNPQASASSVDATMPASRPMREHTLVRGEMKEAKSRSLALSALCLVAALGLGLALGWKALKPRIGQLRENFADRERIYDNARPMARDYPVFGTGPGTFESVFQLYRISTDTYWPAQLHNDWLETRITFGWIGSGLIGLAFGVVLLRWFAPGGIHGGRRFVALIWLALAGCLVHARFDFPLQIYSIVLLFLALCAMLSNLSRKA